MERGEDYGTKHDKNAQLLYLKRRLEDLELMHKEGKKKHAAELDALKNEIERSRKVNKEQLEYMAKLKRQREAGDSQIMELKKAAQTTQLEVRELRHKVRSAEQERDKLLGKQTDAAELRKALNAVDSRKKGDLQEKEKKIMELQKLVAIERQHAAMAEKKAEQLQATLDQHTQELHKNTVELENAAATKEDLQHQIVQLHSYLRAAFEQYANLQLATVSREKYENLELKSAQQRVRLARFERKLANSDDQVFELAHLIRQVQATNKLLSYELSEARSEIEWRVMQSNATTPQAVSLSEDQRTLDEINEFLSEEQEFKNDFQRHYTANLRSRLDLSDTTLNECRRQLYAIEGSLADKEAEVGQVRSLLARTEEAVVKLSEENRSQAEQIEQLTYLNEGHVKGITELRAKLEDASVALVTAEARAKSNIVKLKEDLRKEKDVTTRLHSSLQQNKMAEEALKVEIEQLTGELTTVEGYREAYQNIADEMRGLVARNVLAEEEAMRLSQFNAEILSHRNPTQKIFYVDRIRRELAETKQTLAVSTREHEAIAQENDALRGELALFKSVAVPFAGKPRTNMTRVKRIPFAPANKQTSTVGKRQAIKEDIENYDDLARYLPSVDTGDMTLEELS